MARRRLDTFSLSFLDIMSCGFGAVVLFYMIISATMAIRSDELNKALSERADRLRVEAAEGEENLVELRNTMEETERKTIEARGLARRIIKLIEDKQTELADMEDDTLARQEHINKLKADLKALEEDSKRLSAASSQPDELGDRLRRIQGDGDRQYLTGVKVGGERVLILLDASASMLDETIVNIIRRRNMDDAQKVRSPKWQRALRTTEWLVAQLSPGARFQIVGFNETAASVVSDSAGQWLEAADPDVVDEAIKGSRQLVPGGGTSLHNAFSAVKTFTPRPDNIFLITDGLPTQGRDPPRGKTVSGRTRLRHFNSSLEELPAGIPVNVILMPIEGDAQAATEFWRLAQASQGSFLSPSRDWP
jgi:F0F1-type ATP synthase membrane subunit b/b'